MSDYLGDDKFKIFTTCFEAAADSIMSLRRLKVHDRKMVSEIAIYLQDLLKHLELDNIEKDYVKSWIDNCIHVLGREFEDNFILQFYYFKRNYNEEEEDKDKVIQTLISVLVSLRAITTKSPTLSLLNSTAFGYIERDLSSYRSFLETLFKKEEYFVYPNLLFLLANSIDTFSSVKESEIVEHEVEELLNLVVMHYSKFESLSELSPGSIRYINEIIEKFDLPVDTKEVNEKLLRKKPKLFYLLAKLRNGIDVSHDELGKVHEYTYYEYLWWIVNSWIHKKECNTIIGILPISRKEINIDFIYNSLWGNISEINKVDISDEDINKVLKFNDEDIQKTLYEFLIDHPLVTTHSKVNLVEELNKAHGGGEISDFNFEIELNGEKIWIAMPIKSALESGGSTSEKMKQKYFYQMVRPILYFKNENVAVFPIILTKKTLDTNEFLTLVRAHLNLPILAINNTIYTKIMKRYGILT